MGDISLMFLVHPTLTEEEIAQTVAALDTVLDRINADASAKK